MIHHVCVFIAEKNTNIKKIVRIISSPVGEVADWRSRLTVGYGGSICSKTSNFEQKAYLAFKKTIIIITKK
jgi:hypothetical protein